MNIKKIFEKYLTLSILSLALITPSLSFGRDQVWSYNYDPTTGLLTQADGPRTDVADITTYSYYPDTHYLHTVTQPLGHVTTYNSYDDAGRALSITDPKGITTKFNYYNSGKIQTVTIKDKTGNTSKDRSTHYEYFADGEIKKITTPNGAIQNFIYNNANQLIEINNGLNERIVYELDNTGNKTQVKYYDANNTLVYQIQNNYDELSRLTNVIGNNGQQTYIRYDANNNPIEITNTLSETQEQVFDTLNRLEKKIDPLKAETQFSYNAQDKIQSVTDANGNTTHYEYDGFGNLISQNSPDTWLTTYEYDDANNLIRKTDARGVETLYQYDALNRVTHVIYPQSPNENLSYTYSHAMQTTRRADGYSQVFIPNSFNQINIFGQSDSTLTNLLIAYNYDNTGNLIHTETSSGMQTQYHWDNHGRLVSIEFRPNATASWITVIDQIQYMPFGPEKSYTYGNGLTHNITYTLDYQINQIQVSGINPVLDYSYIYNAVDNIININSGLDSNRSQSFAYDASSRLINAQGIYGEIEYEYDSVGNRLKQTITTGIDASQETFGYAAGSNKLWYAFREPSQEIQFRGYDEAGNIVQHFSSITGLINYQYNNANRRASSNGAQINAEYEYNPQGQRILKKLNGLVSERYLYNENGNLLQVSNSQNNVLRYYIYLHQKLVGMYNAAEGALYYIHHDHLGTPLKLTNQNQQVVWSADYKPFGEAVTTGSQEPYSRFPGQYYDTESGLYYNYFRDYDPSLGRYIQSDPIGLAGGINTFGYAFQNPIRYADPFGLTSWDCVKFDLFLGPFGSITYTCTSECVNSKKTMIRIRIETNGAGFDLGVGIMGSHGNIFNDGRGSGAPPDIDVFNGSYFEAGASGAFGIGYGYGAGTFAGSTGGAVGNLTSPTAGIGAGIGGNGGISKVIWSKELECDDECEND